MFNFVKKLTFSIGVDNMLFIIESSKVYKFL